MGVAERRQREREARLTAVLSATRELVREHGLAGTSSRRIAERCELSEGTVFFYFKNKDEIFVSLLLEGIAFMHRGLEKIGAGRANGRRRLEQLWHWFGEVQAEHPEYLQVFAYLAQPGSTAQVRPEILQDLARRSGDNFRLFSEVLAEALSGSGLSAVDVRRAADLIWGCFFGLTMLARSRQNLGAPAHPEARDFAAIFQFLLRALPEPA